VALRLLPERSDPLHGIVYTANLRCRPERCRQHEPLRHRIIASMRFR
jgi:hypothetical protein